jgi:hypothetical protein
VFGLQAARAKTEYEAYRERVVVPAKRQWQASAGKFPVGARLEPLPMPDFTLGEKETRLLQAWIWQTYHRDLASELAVGAAILAVLLFWYQWILRKDLPNQPPSPPSAAVTPSAAQEPPQP